METINNKELLMERLADLEHKQWIAWSKQVAKTETNLSRDRLQRWSKLWIWYEYLLEKDKKADRVWAKKVLKLVDEHLKWYGTEN